MLIVNGTLVQDLNTIHDDHGIRIEGQTITDVGSTETLKTTYPDDEILDAKGGLIMPASICAHTHFYGAFARGMAIPGAAPKNFPEILSRLWWALDKALDEDTVRLSAQVMLIDAIRHGTTTLFDHHASPNFIEGSLDVIGQAVTDAGLRAVLCYEVTDRDGADKAQAGIAENLRFMESAKGYDNLAATFGLHASLSLSSETLAQCADSAESFHIHVAEHEADQDDSLDKYGKRVVHRLHEVGILGEKSIVAHAVHCDPWELEILRDTKTWLTHQPRSNMNNAVGASALDDMLAADMNVCLGTDGFLHNMWAEWKAAYLLHKVAHRDPRRANGADIAKIALQNNAALTQTFFPNITVGTLTIGAMADVMIVDYHPFTPLTARNLPWHIVFGFESSMINTTIATGKILMQDHQILHMDEAKITAEARALAPSLWDRYQTFATIDL